MNVTNTFYRPTNSASGKIDKILMLNAATNTLTPEDDVLEMFKSTVEAFDESVDFYFIVRYKPNPGIDKVFNLEDYATKLIESINIPSPVFKPIVNTKNGSSTNCTQSILLKDNGRFKFLEIPESIAIETTGLSGWAQDVVNVLQDCSKSFNYRRLLIFSGGLNASIANCLSKLIGSNIDVKKTDFKWRGGNTLADKDSMGRSFLMLRNDVFENNRDNFSGFHADEQRLLVTEYLKYIWGANYILWVDIDYSDIITNPISEYFNHLDMYVMPAGRYNDNGVERQMLLIGEVNDQNIYPNTQDPDILNLGKALDRTASWFENFKCYNGLSFKVIRMPIILFPYPARTPSGNKTLCRVFSYCNCLVENFDGQRNIYLPSYFFNPSGTNFERNIIEIKEDKELSPDMLPMDKFISMNANVEKALKTNLHNFFTRVKFIYGDFWNTFESGGLLHCSTQVLGRKGIDEN